MDLQEVFTAVVKHFDGMAKPATGAKIFASDPPPCRYRAADGNKCFIGALLPRDVYSARYEDHGITNLLNQDAPEGSGATPAYRRKLGKLKAMFADVDKYDLQRLQSIHDDWGQNAGRTKEMTREALWNFGVRKRLAWPADVAKPAAVTEDV